MTHTSAAATAVGVKTSVAVLTELGRKMKLLPAVVIFLFLTVSANSQTVPAAISDPSNIAKVIKERGWDIPGLQQSQVLSRRIVPKGSLRGGAVHVTRFRPKSEFIVSIPIFSLSDDQKTLFMEQRHGEVNLIFKCEVNNRVFAYVVQLVEVFYDSKNRRSGYGEIYGAHYYDNDGDGRFESYEPGEGYVKDLRVPNWVSKAK
ncbi:MAG TPA: hypothetical protein VFD48_12740 [Pyrinomonadaceae bacterium]|nr:hypothetical protein [Pyrinomonadaceae bacterium]